MTIIGHFFCLYISRCLSVTYKQYKFYGSRVVKGLEEEGVDARGSVYPWAFFLGHCDLDTEHCISTSVCCNCALVAAACSGFIEGHNETEVKAVKENRQAGRRGAN